MKLEKNLLYKEALDKVKALKPRTNMMQIEFGYGAAFVMPYEDGVTILQALKNAEGTSRYTSDIPIKPMSEINIETKIIDPDRYYQMTVGTLLGLTMDEVLKMASQEDQAA